MVDLVCHIYCVTYHSRITGVVSDWLSRKNHRHTLEIDRNCLLDKRTKTLLIGKTPQEPLDYLNKLRKLTENEENSI